MLLLFSVFFLPSILAQSGRFDPRAFDNVLYHIQVLVVAIPQVLLVLHILGLQEEFDPKRYGLVRIRARHALSAGVIFLGILLALIPLYVLVAVLPEELSRTMFQAVRWRFTRLELLPILLVSTLAIGYREELFFRAYLMSRLEELSVPLGGRVAISTILFALGHLYQGFAGLLVALLIGTYLAFVFDRSRNIHSIGAAHALYNLAALLGSRFVPS